LQPRLHSEIALSRIIGIFLACCLASTVATGAAQAADAPNVLAEHDRTVPGGWAIQVILPQTQIETTIDIGRVASSANGGGLIGAIVISSMDDKRKALGDSAQARADATIGPLRQVLQGFDVNGLALGTTKAALAKPGWFQPASIDITNDPAIQTRPGFLTSLKAPQFALVGYRYETSPDFTQIRVIAEIQLGRAGAMKGGAPALDPFYRQEVSSIVQLREPSFDPAENVAKWSIGEGKLAKAALASAFARFEQLIPFALSLGQADVKAITATGREKAFAAGYYGPLVERSPDRPGDILIWVNGLVNVQPSLAGDPTAGR